VTDRNTNNIQIFSRESKPFGKTWEEWTANWWQWLLSIPKGSNPCNDKSGENFDKNQNNQNVLFLAGTFGGSAERQITIPSRKAILMPVINFTTSYAEEPTLKSESELISRAKSDIDDIVKKVAIVDGVAIRDLDIYRITSAPFDIMLPDNNVIEATPGYTRAVSDGYWVFLQPLAPGKHKICATGSCSSGKTKVDVIFHVTVTE
jgi:hypothetical protein